MNTAMAPTAAEIDLARWHVACAKKAVDDQRRRLEQLREHGQPTGDAEALLATFENTLGVMRAHLAVEESFCGGRTRQRKTATISTLPSRRWSDRSPG